MRMFLWSIGLVSFLGVVLIALIGVPIQTDITCDLTCSGKLCAIGTIFHKYHQKYGHFPPAYLVGASGNPEHSWRVLLLEYIDEDLYREYRFDEPWNGPNNCQLESRMPLCYSCPSDPNAKKKYQTNYFVVVGNDTLFPGPKAHSLKDIENPTSSTILVVEAIGQGAHWMEPRDLNYDAMSFQPNDQSGMGVSSNHRKSPWVCMVDVSRRRATEFPINQFKEMFLIKSLKN